MSLPPELQVHATKDRVLYRLPFRRLMSNEQGAAGCFIFGGGLAALALAGYVWIAVEALTGSSIVQGLFTCVVASPLGLVGFFGGGVCAWLALGGSSEILLTRHRLFLRERIGPLVFRRSVPTSKITLFRIHPTEPGKGALDIDLQGGAGRRWAVDYPALLLGALASDLSRRKDELLSGAPAGPADVEILDQGLRVTARPTVRQSWLSPLVFLGLVLYTMVLGSLIGVVAERGREHLPAVGSVVGLIWAGGVLAGVHALRLCRRTTVFESSGKALKVIDRDFLGRRVREWPRADVWGFEVAEGRLQFRLANGKRPTVLAGRDGPTLEWIAGILRRGAPKRDVQVLSTATSQGICQVCATGVTERAVWCRRCRTPHHMECWIYTGMCSTYGCREIGYLEA